MSIQIKKKFIKSQVIDGTKVLFLNEDSFKAMKSNGDIAELFKFSNGNKLVMLQMPQVSSDPVAPEDLARKAYVDSQISSEQAAREAAVSTEEARALAAEIALQSEIDAEETRALAAETALQGAIDAEVVARTADVNAEELRASIAESALQTAISTEQYARIAGDADLLSELNLEEARALAAEAELQSEIDAEETRALAAEAGLQSSIDAEQAARIAAVSAEQAAREAADLAEETARIAAVSAEATARAADDLTFLKLDGSRSMEGDLNMEKLSSGSGVVSSYSVYQKPGAGPSAWHIDFVLNDPTNIFQYGGDFWQGVDANTPPDGSLAPYGSISFGLAYIAGPYGIGHFWAVPKQADGITSNFAAAVKIGALDFNLTDNSAFTPEGGLGGSTKYKIIGLADGVSANDAVNKSQLDLETSAREAADAALQAAIDALDSGVSADLAAEIARATAAEATLQSAIDTEKGRVDAILLASDADKDSFAEIVQLINSVDTENDSAFASYVLSNNAALAQEVLDRQAGDTALQSAIDAEETAREAAVSAEAAIRAAADAVLTSDLAAEVARATAAESAEATARAAADAALDARLDVLETDPTTKTYVDQQISSVNSDITDLDGYAQDVRSDLDQEILDRVADVDAEEVRAMAAEAALSASISSEETARIAGDATEASARAAAISSEQAAREAADVALQSAIDAEEVRAMAAEASLQSELDAEETARAAQDLVLDSKIDTKFQESKDYTDQKVADLVASAPTVLDTLKELADALGGDANFATTVASQIANAADNLGDRFMYEQFVVDAGMISAGYMELGYKGFAASMVVSNGRLMMFEGEDYSVSVVGGKSRLTFMGSMLPGEAEALEVGDVVKVKYLKDVR